jgi:hypothetical protein
MTVAEHCECQLLCLFPPTNSLANSHRIPLLPAYVV